MESVDEMVGFEEPSSDADRLAYQVLGAGIDLHRALGPGHLESVCEAALRIELSLRGIPFEPQFRFVLSYKGHPVGGVLIVEIKSCEELAPIHTAQVISYLQATNMQLALLINFNVRRLKDGVERIANTRQH